MLDESVDVERVDGDDVGDLKFAIRERLRKIGHTVWAYVSFAKQSELDEADEESDEE